MRVLALNAGSTSHIAHVYDVEQPVPFEPPKPVWEKKVESATTTFDDVLASYDGPPLDGAGHRIVHPGLRRLTERTAHIDASVVSDIVAATPFAPGHNPLALEGVAAVRRRFGAALPQVAVFDTALGAGAPALATTYPIPHEWTERFGIRRAGFHGISHRDAAKRAARLANEAGRPAARMASIHLGNGCSIAGFRDGVCVEHSMGLTPMEGVMMGTRSGSIDPGILFWLIREQGLDIAEVESALNKTSGLLGISGISADTRVLETAQKNGDERATFALALYVHRLRNGLGAMIAALEGVDGIVFTGPVAEHMPQVRHAIAAGFAYLGLQLDGERNRMAMPDAAIHGEDSPVGAYVIRTLEEWAVAAETAGSLR